MSCLGRLAPLVWDSAAISPEAQNPGVVPERRRLTVTVTEAAELLGRLGGRAGLDHLSFQPLRRFLTPTVLTLASPRSGWPYELFTTRRCGAYTSSVAEAGLPERPFPLRAYPLTACAPDRIRTCGLVIRSDLLYPAELQGRIDSSNGKLSADRGFRGYSCEIRKECRFGCTETRNLARSTDPSVDDRDTCASSSIGRASDS